MNLEEGKALTFELGNMTLTDVKNLVNQTVSPDKTLALVAELEDFLATKKLSNAEVLAATVTALMATLLYVVIGDQEVTSALEPRPEEAA